MKSPYRLVMIMSLVTTLVALGAVQPALAAGELRGAYKASNLIGKDVKNLQGEDLGDIQDIVLDPYYGNIAYAVVSFGGFLGLGDKYFAVPWRALELAQDGDSFLFNVEKDRLKNAPGFDKNNWPDMGNPEWGRQVHAFYDQPVYWESRGTAGMRKAGGDPVTLTGEVLSIKEEFFVIKDQSGREVRLHVDRDTKMDGKIESGDRVQAKATQASHAQSITKLN